MAEAVVMSEFKSLNRFQVYSRAAKRLLMLNTMSGRLPLYLVTEFPKSGGTWTCQMLATYLELPFPRNNEAAKFEKSLLLMTQLYKPQFQNVTVAFRDGRDIMVSAYHHFLFRNKHNVEFGVQRTRRLVPCEDYNDVMANMPKFIDYMFGWFADRRFHYSWSQFIDSWIDRDAQIVKYEQLLDDPHAHMKRALMALGQDVDDERLAKVIEQYSFKNVTGRKQGEEAKNTFARKGISGDWKNNFSVAACERFHKYAGEHLIKAGYESDDSWIEAQAKRLAEREQGSHEPQPVQS